MEKVALGSTDVSVSRLCLGSMGFGWTATEAQSFAVLDAFASVGGNFIDTADIYSNWAPGNSGGEAERIIGRWLQARGGRKSFVIATKARGRMWQGDDGEGLSRAHLIRAVDESLARLGVETIDLFQFHWFDERVPIEESLRAMEELVKAGKVRYVGASNYPVALLQEEAAVARDHGLPRFETLQPHHSLVHRREFEGRTQEHCIAEGIGVIPYSPLAGGFLTGKYVRGGERVRSQRAGGVQQYVNDDGWAVLDEVRRIAAAHETTPSAVALAWQLAQPAITAPIVGANSPEQLAEQLPGVDLTLSPDELDRLGAVSAPFLREGTAHSGG